MFEYIEGVITDLSDNHLILFNNGFGFYIYISDSSIYNINDKVKLYLYNHIRESEYSLYGFNSLEDRDLFLKLLNVKGLGPKTAINILSNGSLNIVNAIMNDNILYLKQFPKVGDKLAKQIILDLKGKLNINSVNLELTDALVSLGYKKSEINSVINNININSSLEEQIKEALILLCK